MNSRHQMSGTSVPTGNVGMHEGDWAGSGLEQLADGPANDDPLGDIKTGIKAWFDVGVSVGESTDQLTRSVDRLWRRLQRDTPVYYSTVASGVFATGTPLVLRLGSPDQGTYWEVSSCAVGGTDYNVTAAGTAGLYVAANANATGIGTLADIAATLPNVAFYGTHQLIVNDQELLLVVINAGTNGQTYAANASVNVYNVAVAGGVVEGTT